jgi:hypothetical protein
MKLTRTEPMASSSPTASISSAPIKTAQYEDDDEEVNEGPLNLFAGLALAGSIAALFVAILGFSAVKPFVQPDVGSTKSDRDAWASGGKSDWKIPAKYNPFATEKSDGSYTSTYNEKKESDHALITPPTE